MGLLRFRIHQKAPRSALCRRGLAQGPVRLARRARLVPLAARREALELHAVARSAAAIRAGRLVRGSRDRRGVRRRAPGGGRVRAPALARRLRDQLAVDDRVRLAPSLDVCRQRADRRVVGVCGQLLSVVEAGRARLAVRVFNVASRREREGYGEPCDVTSLSLSSKKTAPPRSRLIRRSAEDASRRARAWKESVLVLYDA